MLGRQLLFVMGRDAGNEYAPTLLGSLPACINDADGVCTMVRPIPSPSIHLQLPDIWQPADVCLSHPCRSPSTTRTDRFSFRLTPALSHHLSRGRSQRATLSAAAACGDAAERSACGGGRCCPMSEKSD